MKTLEERLQEALSDAIYLSDLLAELSTELPQPAKDRIRQAYLATEDVAGQVRRVIEQVTAAPWATRSAP